jgi:hypothetical protein
LDLLLYKVAILTPLSAFYTGLDANNQPQSFEDWINAGIHAADPVKRFYPFPEMRSVEDSSKEPTVFTDDYGEDTTLFDGNFGFSQKFRPDACLNKRLFAFNNQQFRVIIIDNENSAQVIRTPRGIAGEQFKVFVTSPKANTASEVSQPTVTYSATQSDEHKLREVIKTDLQWSELKGLEDIVMNVVKSDVNLFITFSPICSGDDITGELAALSEESSAWLQQTGTGIPTPINPAPAYLASTGSFKIPASSITGDKIGLADPSVLQGLGIANMDCPDMVTVPA